MGNACVQVSPLRRAGLWIVAGVGLVLLVTPSVLADGETRRITFTNGRTVDAEVVTENEREIVIRVGGATQRIDRALIRSVGEVRPSPDADGRRVGTPASPSEAAQPRKGAVLAAAIENEADEAVRERLVESVLSLSTEERAAFVDWARTTRQDTGGWLRLAPALGRLDEGGAARELVQMLKVEQERGRGDVVAALASCSARVGVPALLERVGKASIAIRETVVQTGAVLAAREPRDAFVALRRAVDAGPEDRILGQVVAQLVEGAYARTESPREFTWDAASQIDCDPVALGLARGLATRKAPTDVTDVLRRLADSRRSETREAAVRAAALNGKLGDWGSRLVTILRDDGTPEVRQAAWQALKSLSGEDRPFSWKSWADLLEAKDGP